MGTAMYGNLAQLVDAFHLTHGAVSVALGTVGLVVLALGALSPKRFAGMVAAFGVLCTLHLIPIIVFSFVVRGTVGDITPRCYHTM